MNGEGKLGLPLCFSMLHSHPFHIKIHSAIKSFFVLSYFLFYALIIYVAYEFMTIYKSKGKIMEGKLRFDLIPFGAVQRSVVRILALRAKSKLRVLSVVKENLIWILLTVFSCFFSSFSRKSETRTTSSSSSRSFRIWWLDCDTSGRCQAFSAATKTCWCYCRRYQTYLPSKSSDWLTWKRYSGNYKRVIFTRMIPLVSPKPTDLISVKCSEGIIELLILWTPAVIRFH